MNRLKHVFLVAVLAASINACYAQDQSPGDPGEGEHGLPPMPQMPLISETKFTSSVRVNEGKYKVFKGTGFTYSRKKISDTHGSDIEIKSDKDNLNAVLVTGKNSIYKLSNSEIDLNGRGTNDFLGLGAGAMVAEGMMLLENVEIETAGAISTAVVAAEGATLKAINSKFITHGGPLPEDYVPKIGPGMMEPPAPLEIKGTARTVLTMSNAHAYFYNCEIIADGWGALSTDAAGGDAYLEANDSTVIVNNSGYGAYADFGARVVLNRTSVDAATYTGIIAGEAKMEMNDSTTTSNRNVLMIHSVMGNPFEIGQLTINGGVHKSKEAAFDVKSANAEINLNNTKIEPGNKIILRARINPDSFRTKVNGASVPGSSLNVSQSSLSGNVVNEDSERSVSVNLTRNSSLVGKLDNVLLSSDESSTWLATENSDISVQSEKTLSSIDAKRGVIIKVSGMKGKSSIKLASGGTLTFVR